MKRVFLFLAAFTLALPFTGDSQLAAHNTLVSSGNTGGNPAVPAASASVTGTVKFAGPIPKAQPVAMQADPTCAKEHSGPVRSEEVVTGNDGALGNVIVFVAQGLENHTFDLPQAPAVMEQKGCMYEPHVIAMRAGQTLRLVNADKTMHNIHPMPTNNREWNKAQTPGQHLEETFSREEIAIPVKCNIHPWMHSYIAVFKHPYFAVTTKDGNFDLSNLPPGDYTIEAWHEKLGTQMEHIKVGQGETKKIEFTFKPKA